MASNVQSGENETSFDLYDELEEMAEQRSDFTTLSKLTENPRFKNYHRIKKGNPLFLYDYKFP